MTTFTKHAEDYLQLRRSFGFKLQEHGRLLPSFAAHLDAIGAEHVSVELAVVWATEPVVRAGSRVPGMRLLIVRGWRRDLPLACIRAARCSRRNRRRVAFSPRCRSCSITAHASTHDFAGCSHPRETRPPRNPRLRTRQSQRRSSNKTSSRVTPQIAHRRIRPRAEA
jgi:hypothetical protein